MGAILDEVEWVSVRGKFSRIDTGRAKGRDRRREFLPMTILVLFRKEIAIRATARINQSINQL